MKVEQTKDLTLIDSMFQGLFHGDPYLTCNVRLPVPYLHRCFFYLTSSLTLLELSYPSDALPLGFPLPPNGPKWLDMGNNGRYYGEILYRCFSWAS